METVTDHTSHFFIFSQGCCSSLAILQKYRSTSLVFLNYQNQIHLQHLEETLQLFFDFSSETIERLVRRQVSTCFQNNSFLEPSSMYQKFSLAIVYEDSSKRSSEIILFLLWSYGNYNPFFSNVEEL